MENANSARAKVGSRRLKVSPILTAISMIDADYQKQGGVHHPQYYKYEDSLENISAGSEPITIWMTEKNNWKEDVRKNSSLKSLEFHPNWDNQAYTDAVMGAHGYKVAGHYTNLVNRNHRIMGMAHMTDNNYGYADVYNTSSKNNKGSLTLEQYNSLVNKWLNR
nr:CAP domain-containing protein [Lactobacillus helveticus]